MHGTWVVRYTSTLETRINYAPTDVFLTLPRPPTTSAMGALGERLDTDRRAVMLGRGWGLTTTYNHVHDPADRDPEILQLRHLHQALDRAVFDAYGWDDLDPEVGHHRTKIGCGGRSARRFASRSSTGSWPRTTAVTPSRRAE
ncbi:MAG: hypothetical protein M3063_09550 [Actinomycetota bacterium]|nr:hypothetical protein [Actinomycetota bacterium]